MKVYSSFTVSVHGVYADILEAVDFLSETITDQSCWTEFSNTCFYDGDHIDEDDFDDDDPYENQIITDNEHPALLEECFDVWETQKCVWIEDIQKMAAELSYLVPNVEFTVKGHIEDNISGSNDMMDFLIEYKKGKLTSRTSDWYIHIYMDDFEDYYEFGDRFTSPDGRPRYSEEDYEGCACADEWYVLDAGNGEFSTDVPLGETCEDQDAQTILLKTLVNLPKNVESEERKSICSRILPLL